jgi:hypothetical protein
LALIDSTAIASGGIDVIRTYEDASTAIGRLDAAGRLAPAGLRELLVLRCAATAVGATHSGMIALVRADGEGPASHRAYADALREGAARARGGALPSVAYLHALLRLPGAGLPVGPIDDLLRDVHERTPPVLKAALAALALRAAARVDPDESGGPAELLPALVATLVLCVGGATTDAWLTLPPAPSEYSLSDAFAAFASEARASERGLAAARKLCDADVLRVREALGRAAYSALDTLALLRDQIVITVPEAARTLGLTPPTAGAAVARLVELGIAREVTGRARSRAFAYDAMAQALAPSRVTISDAAARVIV